MNERKALCVYTHSTGGKVFYAGHGSRGRPSNLTDRTPRWHAHVEKHGEPKIVIRAWTNDREEAKRVEAELIEKYRPSCNVRKHDRRKYPVAAAWKAPLSIALKPSLKAALMEAAAQDGRTISQFTERLLEAAMRDQGFLE
jgi:hypothetical protein